MFCCSVGGLVVRWKEHTLERTSFIVSNVVGNAHMEPLRENQSDKPRLSVAQPRAPAGRRAHATNDAVSNIGFCGSPSWSRVHYCSTRPPEQGKMPIFGGFARRPNVNGLSPWVASTEVYVKWAKAIFTNREPTFGPIRTFSLHVHLRPPRTPAERL